MAEENKSEQRRSTVSSIASGDEGEGVYQDTLGAVIDAFPAMKTKLYKEVHRLSELIVQKCTTDAQGESW